MTRYSHLLETRNCFANDDLWRGHARVLLVLACAGTAACVVSGAEWDVYPGA
jgi:hypothetical protein